jgi:hypothetical protein
MAKTTSATSFFLITTGLLLTWSSASLAAANGNMGVSASVMERCRIDFSQGSADYFQSCSSAEVKASGTASNVLGELSAVEASADPYYLDRNPDSQGIATNDPKTSGNAERIALDERKRRAPKVVTINY